MNDFRMPQYRIGASTLSPQEGLTRSDPVRRWGHFANRSVRRCVRFWPKFRALLHYPTLWCIQGWRSRCLHRYHCHWNRGNSYSCGCAGGEQLDVTFKIISIAHLFVNHNSLFSLASSLLRLQGQNGAARLHHAQWLAGMMYSTIFTPK